jgi:hypothetical protein
MDSSDLIIAVGFVGSVASIMALLLAAPGVRSKLLHIGYGIFITMLMAGVLELQHRASQAEQQLQQLKLVEKEAKAILTTADRSTSGSMAGFMLASLSFLEKHKDRFPETYVRAVTLCENSGCVKSGYSGKEANSTNHFYSMQEASGAMEYLVKGIAVSGDVR